MRGLRLVICNTGRDFLGYSIGSETYSQIRKVVFTTKYTGHGGYEGETIVVGAVIQLRKLYWLENKQSPLVAVNGGQCLVG